LAAVAVGTNTIVPAVAGARIRVMSLVVVATAAATVRLQSHVTTSNKTGTPSLAANGGMVWPYNPDGWFVTQAGEALDMVVGGTGPVEGTLSYVTL